MTVDKDAQAKTSYEIEEWAVPIPEIIRLLRMGQGNEFAYALMYQLRRELTHIMNNFPWGGGQPQKRILDQAHEVFESQRWRPNP